MGSNPTYSASDFMLLSLSESERSELAAIRKRLLQAIETNERILLPKFDPEVSKPHEQFAMVSVGIEPNEFGSSIGEYRYQLEGEEDLLHLMVTRVDGSELSPEEGQTVAETVWRGLDAGLIWFKPGRYSQHYYCGHDDLEIALRAD